MSFCSQRWRMCLRERGQQACLDTHPGQPAAASQDICRRFQSARLAPGVICMVPRLWPRSLRGTAIQCTHSPLSHTSVKSMATVKSAHCPAAQLLNSHSGWPSKPKTQAQRRQPAPRAWDSQAAATPSKATAI